MNVIPIPIAVKRYRVMFDDGTVEDYLAARDDSLVRGAMLDAHYGKRGADKSLGIAGVVDLGVEYTHSPLPARML